MKPIWEAIAGSFKKMAEAGKGVLFVVAGDLVCAAAPAADPTPEPPPSHSRCFVLAVFKNIPGPSAGTDFHLGDVTKPRFLRGFGLQEGAQGGKKCILRSLQHRWPKHGPNIAPKMAQHGPT